MTLRNQAATMDEMRECMREKPDYMAMSLPRSFADKAKRCLQEAQDSRENPDHQESRF